MDVFFVHCKVNSITMRKPVLLLLFMAALPLLGQENLNINLDAPAHVVAGHDFEVTITFNKGDLKDYSRFNQDLPNGVTARNIESPNADFTFTEQRVRIIWLKLPADPVVTVKYAITVDPRITGTLKLGGTFAYVNNGERAYLDLSEPKSVQILPNPDLDQAQIVDIKDYDKLATMEAQAAVQPAEEAAGGNIMVVRQKPVVEANGIVNVTLLVHKPEGTTFLKLEETIPGGYSFEAVESRNAVVSQAASLARFVWMRPPASSNFTVSYKLVPILERQQEALNIDGTLSYTENGASKVAPVKEMEVNLVALNAEQKAALLETGVIPEGIAQQTVQKPVEKTPVETTSTTKTTPSATQTTPAKTTAKTTTRPAGSRSGTLDIDELGASSGVYFRVQIAAVRNPYFAETYFAGYDLLKDVKVEKISGWHKYTVGPLSSYDEAVTLKKKIISETPVKEAFVVAYRDGKRIPVSEVQ